MGNELRKHVTPNVELPNFGELSENFSSLIRSAKYYLLSIQGAIVRWPKNLPTSLSFKSHLPIECNLFRVWKWFPLRAKRTAVSQAAVHSSQRGSLHSRLSTLVIRPSIGSIDLHLGLTLATGAIYSGCTINKFPLADEYSREHASKSAQSQASCLKHL